MKLLTPKEILEALEANKALEVKFAYDIDDEWIPFNRSEILVENILNPRNSFRLAPEKITIGDVSFPKPETKAPKSGMNYFFPSFIKPSLVDFYEWTSDDVDYKLLRAGLIHLSKENAFAHAKALLKLSGGTYE